MKMNLNVSYTKQGDYLIPNLAVKEEKDVHIGVWANRHRQYLKCYHKVRYYNLLTSEKLYDYLSEIDEQSEKYFQNLVKSLTEKENITEKLKAESQFLWVQ